ncbi:hypothetical protein CEXT_812331, partial [Caerostris extrusa]
SFICIKLVSKMDVDVTPQCVTTCLYLACLQNNVEHAELLLKQGANINALNAYSQTPLHFACQGRSTACLDLLLKMGADVHTPQSPITPLHIACREDTVECAEILLKYGANRQITIGTTEDNKVGLKAL